MHSRSDSEKTHYFIVIDDETAGVMSACGHFAATMWEVDLDALHPLHTTCAGCLRSRHHRRALKQLEDTPNADVFLYSRGK